MTGKERLEAVLWDLDGTILDTREQHFLSSQRVFDKYGLKVERGSSKPYYGKTSREIFRDLLGKDFDTRKLISLIKEKDEIFRSLIIHEARFLPGVEACLRTFQSLGVAQAVASSTSMKNIEFLLDALNARAYFDRLFSGEELTSKPDPAVFLLASTELGIAPANCLVIEDSPFGVQAAKAARMKCLAVAGPFRLEDLAQADLALDSLEDFDLEEVRGLFSEVQTSRGGG